MKKHPVISGFLLLAIVGVSFFLILRVLVFFGEENQEFSFKNKDKIGVVTIEGVLHSSADIIKQLETYEKDGNVKAVVLRINSPGGAVVPSQEIYDKVLRLKKSKKVVVSMGTVAASGGYYIACAADRIVANPGTITGSYRGHCPVFSNRRFARKDRVEDHRCQGRQDIRMLGLLCVK